LLIQALNVLDRTAICHRAVEGFRRAIRRFGADMHLSDIIDPKAIASGVKAQNKKQLLQDLAQGLASQTAVDSRIIFETLLQREKLGSTGLGQGIAIPHGRLPSINRVYGYFARLSSPVDFDSVDGEPVDLVFALVSPGHAGADHLTALARISRVLRDGAMLAKLRGATGADSLYALLTDHAITPASAA
jgi:PTS system nitrogen regulatory IIA component